MILKNQTILITSNEPWGDVWYSKQNYAYELSKTNRVYFINPQSKWKITNLFYNKVIIKKYSDSLNIIEYKNYLPGITDFTKSINNYFVSKLLNKYFIRNNISIDIFWAFDPIRLFQPSFFKPKLSIYHCVDKYYLKYYGVKRLATNCDLLFAVSNELIKTYSNYKIRKYIIPHAISIEEFHINIDIAKENEINLENYGLYIGNIDDRIDYVLLEKIVKQFPDETFAFIGPVTYLPENEFTSRLFQKKLYNNVHLLGIKHFKELKYYINKAKFCFYYANKNLEARIISSHKILSYLSQGKPLFSYKLKEYATRTDIIYFYDSNEEAIVKLNRFLKQGEEPLLVEKRKAFAQEFTFEKIIKKIESYLPIE